MSSDPAAPAAASFRKREADPSPTPPPADKDAKPTECSVCQAGLDPEDLYCGKCSWAVNENRAFDITDDELENFLFHGFVQRGFTFFSGRIKIELRTLQAGDYNKITRHMGEYAGGRRSIQADYSNEDRLVTLSHSLSTWMGKEVKDVAMARAALEATGEGLLELIQDRFNRLVLGIDREIKKEMRVKNS